MTELRGALLVGGTSSDAGKSLVVAGLCRALAREGVRVAPFKAQNMSNNSVVTLDGGEIGRAQALQATACGLAPSTRFNPVLLKPGSDRRSHVVVRGRPAGDVGARDYLTRRAELREVVADELASLRAEFDVVICEGAGSVAEINLRASDIANMGLARSAGLPVILVSDIDRGGSLAHLFGTTAILDSADQALVAGYVINKFRGDQTILDPGLHTLGALTTEVEAVDESVVVQGPQRLRQHLRGDALDMRLERAEAHRAVGERGDDEHRPPRPDPVQHNPTRTRRRHHVVRLGHLFPLTAIRAPGTARRLDLRWSSTISLKIPVSNPYRGRCSAYRSEGTTP